MPDQASCRLQGDTQFVEGFVSDRPGGPQMSPRIGCMDTNYDPDLRDQCSPPLIQATNVSQ